MEIIKKEDGLRFGHRGFFTSPTKGALTLTDDTLVFNKKGSEEVLFSVQLKDILNVRAQFLQNQDALVILYTDNGAEKKAQVWHRGEIGIHNLGGVVREPFFKSWEAIIEQKRQVARSNTQ